jgi:hypothetical protein
MSLDGGVMFLGDSPRFLDAKAMFGDADLLFADGGNGS